MNRSADILTSHHSHHRYHPSQVLPSQCTCWSSTDHSRALRVSVTTSPRNQNRQLGQLRHTRLQTVKSVLAPLNTGLATAYHRVQSGQAWSTVVGMATFSIGQAIRWWWWWCQLTHDVPYTTTTPPQPFYGPFSGTTQFSRCQKRTSGLYGARED